MHAASGLGCCFRKWNVRKLDYRFLRRAERLPAFFLLPDRDFLAGRFFFVFFAAAFLALRAGFLALRTCGGGGGAMPVFGRSVTTTSSCPSSSSDKSSLSPPASSSKRENSLSSPLSSS